MTEQAAGNSGSFDAIALTASLTVKDLHKSVAYFTDGVGFEIGQKHERDGQLRAVEIKAGGVRMLLNQDDGAKGWERVKGQGFAFMITTKDVDSVAARMNAAGYTPDSEPADMPWGSRAFRFTDPDGYAFVVATPR